MAPDAEPPSAPVELDANAGGRIELDDELRAGRRVRGSKPSRGRCGHETHLGLGDRQALPVRMKNGTPPSAIFRCRGGRGKRLGRRAGRDAGIDW